MAFLDAAGFLFPVPHSYRVWGTGELTRTTSFPPHNLVHQRTGELNEGQRLAVSNQVTFSHHLGFSPPRTKKMSRWGTEIALNLTIEDDQRRREVAHEFLADRQKPEAIQ